MTCRVETVRQEDYVMVMQQGSARLARSSTASSEHLLKVLMKSETTYFLSWQLAPAMDTSQEPPAPPPATSAAAADASASEPSKPAEAPSAAAAATTEGAAPPAAAAAAPPSDTTITAGGDLQDAGPSSSSAPPSSSAPQPSPPPVRVSVQKQQQAEEEFAKVVAAAAAAAAAKEDAKATEERPVVVAAAAAKADKDVVMADVPSASATATATEPTAAASEPAAPPAAAAAAGAAAAAAAADGSSAEQAKEPAAASAATATEEGKSTDDNAIADADAAAAKKKAAEAQAEAAAQAVLAAEEEAAAEIEEKKKRQAKEQAEQAQAAQQQAEEEEQAVLAAQVAEQARQQAAAAALQSATTALLTTAQVATSQNLPGLAAAVNAALPSLTSTTTPSSHKSSASAATLAETGATREGILAASSAGCYLPSLESIKKEATKAVSDNPPYVHLSARDTAPQLRIEDGPDSGRRLTLRGGMRGYRMSRGTHGVSSGTYYYEIMILPPAGAREVVRNLPDVVRLGDGLRENLKDDLVREVMEKEDAERSGGGGGDENAAAAATAAPSKSKRARKSTVGTPPNYDASKLTGHVRIGWSMRTGDLQAPVGYDRWSYGFRDILGSRVHRSRREDRWGGEPFGPGDVMGLCITMVNEEGGGDGGGNAAATSSSSSQTGNHIRLFKNGHALGHFEIVRGAKLGGEAFTDVTPGTYYPAVSSYMGGSVRVNFGPHFVYPPPKTLPGGWKPSPVSDLCPPPLEPKEAAAQAVRERNFPKKTDDFVIKAFQEAVEVEAKVRSKCYKAHFSKHVEEVRRERELRNLNTSDLPASKSNNASMDIEGEDMAMTDVVMQDIGA